MGIWSDLYDSVKEKEKSLKKQGITPKIRKDPTDDDSDHYTELEVAYLKTRMKTLSDMEKRRGYKKYKNIIFVQKARRPFEPGKHFSSEIEYTFLQYIGLIKTWAKAKWDLTDNEFYLLLYIYPIGVFDQAEFSIMREALGVKTNQIFYSLKKKNMIQEWDNVPGERKLYCLTWTGREVCGQAHRISLGKQKISSTRQKNPLVTFRDSVYNKLFDKMNERVEE